MSYELRRLSAANFHFSIRNLPCGDDEVGDVVVDGGVLAGSDALDAHIGEDGNALLCANEMSLREVGGMAYLEFHIYGGACFELLTPKVAAEVMEVEQVNAIAILRIGVVALRHIEYILVDVLLHHKPGAAAEQETFALSDGVEPVAAVGAEDATGFELDNLPFALTEIAAQEVVVVYLAEKTDALRVLAVGAGQMGSMSNVAHLAFHHAANGEHQFADLSVGELREEVGLVLYRVLGSRQKNRLSA